MVYPWNRKKKKEPKAEELETIVEENQSEDNLESEVLNENKDTLPVSYTHLTLPTKA